MIQRSIHYKSDFKLRLANEIDWSTPFKARFFTTRPVSAMEVSYDGTTYKGCRVDEEGKLVVTFDRFTQLHRQGLGNLMMELSYNIDDDQFADNSFDRILAPQKVVCIDDEDNEFELVLGLNGDSHVEVECSVIAAYKKGDPGDTPEIGENGNWWIGGVDTEVKADYSSEEALRQSQEAARVAAETTRQSNETQRQSGETTRQSNEATRQSKETERQTNETARQNAEAQRQQTFSTNEAARQTAYQNAESNRNGAYEEAEQDRDEEFASKEATRDAANQAALNCAETLAALGPEIYGERTQSSTTYEGDTFNIAGFANSGGSISSSTTAVITDFIPLDNVVGLKGCVITNNQYGGAISFWRTASAGASSIVGMIGMNTTSQTGNVNSVVEVTSSQIAEMVSLGANYVVFCARIADEYWAIVTTETITGSGLKQRVKSIEDVLPTINENITQVSSSVNTLTQSVGTLSDTINGSTKEETIEIDADDFSTAGFVNAGGSIASSETAVMTDFYPIENLQSIQARVITNNQYGGAISFWKTNASGVTNIVGMIGKGTTSQSGNVNSVVEVTRQQIEGMISLGAKYVVFCARVADTKWAQMTSVEVVKSIDEKFGSLSQRVIDLDKTSIDLENTRLGLISDKVKPLKVFFLGNSFAVQSCMFFANLCKANGIPLTIGISYVGGATLQGYDEWYGKDKDSSTTSIYRKFKNNNWIYGDDSELRNVFSKLTDEDWDIIFIQQGSASADSYSTYQPYAENVVDWIDSVKKYSRAKLGLLMPWAWSDSKLQNDTTAGGATTHAEMYSGIVNATKSLLGDIDFDFVAKQGVAIERLYSLGFTQQDIVGTDGQHLSGKISLVTAGLRLFLTLIPSHYNDIDFDAITWDDEQVTSEMFTTAKTAATYASDNW